MTRFVLPLLAAMVLLAGCRSGDGTQQASYDAMPSGQKLFLTHCVSCHMGVGDPPGPNAVVMSSPTLKSEPEFKDLLRNPRSPMMRAFGVQDLSDAEVQELYTYVKGLQKQGQS